MITRVSKVRGVAWGICVLTVVSIAQAEQPLKAKKSAEASKAKRIDMAVALRRCESNDECRPRQYCAMDDCDGPGVCRRRPNACPDVWDPVCGCDGVTYGNKCEAAAAGVNVAYPGECDELCGGIAGIPCSSAGDFCKTAEGECCCDFFGVCTPMPEACPEYYDPVCGCDGVTYSNECFSDAAGVSVDHVGACEPPCCDPALEPGTNGNPPCFEGATCCADGIWRCNNGDGTPSCDPGEVCEVIGKCCLEGGACVETTEEDCFMQCGVYAGDGTECTGLSLDCPIPPIIVAACCLPDGSCTVTTECLCGRQGGEWGAALDCSSVVCDVPEICGGIAGIPCSAANDFCKTAEGECCCDFFGVCTPMPELCPLIYDPVCGCDGVTYGNECFSDAAGVSVDFHDACESGCQTNADCMLLGPGFTEFCQKAAGDCDGTGECAPRPDACLDVWIPVCGCDGQTYSNGCYAHRAGVNVAYEDACSSLDQ